ncbi:hydroxyacylglutathione hydrolase [Microvirga sp. W0021]|uniref:Hydroxyacylglutathione hydrolase n=1 Tax=Hohaiivirga grylli TaxID=3133970 RepID=A0ABV0BL25_9HYPH
MPLEIKVFRCLSDNIGVLVRDADAGLCIAVDAPDSDTIIKHLDDSDWQLTDILVTHSHTDHVQGIAALKDKYGCFVTAPLKAEDIIPEADAFVSEGDLISLGELEIDVIETPGHCDDHVAYIVQSHGIAFVGDVLFTLGCGRVFGDYQDMWDSIERLRNLPDDIQIFCGHDYTLSNGRFALAVEPDNHRLKERFAEAEKLAAENRFMVPFALVDEKATNPFLRVEVPEVSRSVNMEGAAPFEVFKALREWKNKF